MCNSPNISSVAIFFQLLSGVYYLATFSQREELASLHGLARQIPYSLHFTFIQQRHIHPQFSQQSYSYPILNNNAGIIFINPLHRYHILSVVFTFLSSLLELNTYTINCCNCCLFWLSYTEASVFTCYIRTKVTCKHSQHYVTQYKQQNIIEQKRGVSSCSKVTRREEVRNMNTEMN